MIKIADYNELQVLTIKIDGCFLDGGSDSVFLPALEMPDGTAQGDYLDVYLYKDRRGMIRATTKIAPAVMNGFGAFKVKSIKEYGAFLDWGAGWEGRDLFIPKRFINSDFSEGDMIVVRLIPDVEELSVIGTEFFSRALDKAAAELAQEENDLFINGEEADLLVYGENGIGYAVIVNDAYPGIIYKNETFEPLKRGDRKRGYIKKIREDGKIDISLQKLGFKSAVGDTRERVLDILKERGGHLSLGDKSDPEEIKRELHMSKKMFKKTIGGLYKEGLITIADGDVTLKRKN